MNPSKPPNLDYSTSPTEPRVEALIAGIASMVLGAIQYFIFVAGAVWILAFGHPVVQPEGIKEWNFVLGLTAIPIPVAAILGLFAIWRATNIAARIFGILGTTVAIGWTIAAVSHIK